MRACVCVGVCVCVCLTAGGGGVLQRQGLVPGREAPQQVRALGGHGGGPLVHLLGGDVVVEQRLAVLQGRGVRVAPDQVGVGVGVGVGRVGGQVAGQVVGRCGDGGRGGKGQPVRFMNYRTRIYMWSILWRE